MGAVASRPDADAAAYVKDQNRFTISNVSITSSRQPSTIHLTPNAFPASHVSARREDGGPVDFILDPNGQAGAPPSFLLRVDNDEDLTFRFTIVLHQTPSSEPTQPGVETVINGLTFVFAESKKELDVLVTREFHADPNLHKNSNVELVRAELSTEGSPSTQFEYVWKWKQPKSSESRFGGWRNACTFVEYDQRAHRLNTLASFTFWVNNSKSISTPLQQPVQGDSLVPPRMRLASRESHQSVLSDTEGPDAPDPPSPIIEPGDTTGIPQPKGVDPATVDVTLPRAGDDMSAVEDGPLFRATMKALESKTGSMRARMKKVLKRAEAAQIAQASCNDAVSSFMDALREASRTNANAIQPALDHYFERIAREILSYEKQNTKNLQKLIIEPLAKLYSVDIKAADQKKKEFEEESKDYYAYVGRYLGQRQDSLKEKKRNESDSKYQSKRRNFELRRFDYSSFMTDLHGGRKEQEVLSHLTKFADTQTKSYLETAKKIEEMMPQLDALIKEVSAADKEYRIQRTEREEKRRHLEKSNNPFDSESGYAGSSMTGMSSNGPSYASDTESGKETGGRGMLQHSSSVTSQPGNTSGALHPSSSVKSISGSPMPSPAGPDRFKGIRDLEDRSQMAGSGQAPGQQRKEGLLWALSKPGGGHVNVDPRNLNKQGWHKFWIVLDQGKLSEYNNWKDRLDLHMDPIDLRLASVREARNSERRFCFEVITPTFKRVYQATSEDDMSSWINAVNNALQSAFESRSPSQPSGDSQLSRDIGSVLTGKSHSQSVSAGVGNAAPAGVLRRTTVAGRPRLVRTESNQSGEEPAKLLQEIRERDQGNAWCADCGSTSKVEWVSINLGILLCIECSGIHRSLGTHISKVRSMTLDTKSFTVDIVEILIQIGNRLSNQVWEANLDQGLKPAPTATRDERLRFVTSKYIDRLYVQPILAGQSQWGTPDDTLLASVKQNDILQVLYALANKANPNARDKSRSTPAIFLALAAADPASPHPATASSVSSTKRNKSTPAFPVAELLLQNGGELPAQLPAFPLSPAARQYVEQRNKRASADTLTALPSIRGPGAAGSELQREKLQKRNSSGNRYAGRIPGLGGGGGGGGGFGGGASS